MEEELCNIFTENYNKIKSLGMDGTDLIIHVQALMVVNKKLLDMTNVTHKLMRQELRETKAFINYAIKRPT